MRLFSVKVFLLASIVAFVVACASQLQSPAPRAECALPTAASKVRAPRRPLPGEYAITLTALSGSEQGSRARGRLFLEQSRPGEGFIWSARGVRSDTGDRPLIGYITADLRRVGAPIAPKSDTLHPAPTSRDRKFPGVVALADLPREQHQASERVVLLIGTLFNRRDSSLYIDGAGIQLVLNAVSDSQMTGSWDEFGIIANGTGVFCAVRVR